MSTYDEDETGVETSQPRETFEIVTPAETWRLASGVRDVTIDGNVYTASPVRRGTVGPSPTNGPLEFTFELPASHPFAQRCTQYGGVPQNATLTVWRHQLTSGESERIWCGIITAVSLNGNVATINAPSRLGAVLSRRLPTVTASRSCRHVLFDSGCTVSRASHVVSTTIAGINGRTVTIASIGGQADAWATFGTLKRIATGETISIAEQIGTTLTLRVPVVGLTVGEAVEVTAGCARDVSTCSTKFSNVPNFGGFPSMPTQNAFRLDGLGIVVQE